MDVQNAFPFFLSGGSSDAWPHGATPGLAGGLSPARGAARTLADMPARGAASISLARPLGPAPGRGDRARSSECFLVVCEPFRKPARSLPLRANSRHSGVFSAEENSVSRDPNLEFVFPFLKKMVLCTFSWFT